MKEGTIALALVLLLVDPFDSSQTGINLSTDTLLPTADCYSVLLVEAMCIDHYFSRLED